MKKFVIALATLLVATIALIAGCMGAGRDYSTDSAPAAAGGAELEEPAPENPDIPEVPQSPYPKECPDGGFIYRLPAHGFEIFIKIPADKRGGRGGRVRFYPFKSPVLNDN